MRSSKSRTIVAGAAAGITSFVTAGPEYAFTLVDAFTPSYDLRECYIYDINDENVACGTATIQIGPSITYSGFYWMPPNEKTPIQISWPHGINNGGLMAGVAQAYDIPAGEFTTLPLLPATYYPLVLQRVNEAGLGTGYVQICNCSNSQGALQIPYLWDAENGARTLAVPGAKGAAAANNNGLVVGWTGGWSMPDSYVYDLNSESYTLMSTVFGGTNTQTTAVDVNDNDVVVGSRKNTNGTITWGYTWTAGGGVTLLPLPPAGYQPALRPTAINDAGTIVGAIYTPNATSHAFVYDAAHGVRDLNTLTEAAGFTLMTATAVNDNGWIVGYGYGGGGMYKSYVLRPVVAGDIDADGTIGIADLWALLGTWGPCAACAECPADLDGDCAVGIVDLLVLLGNWTRSTSPSRACSPRYAHGVIRRHGARPRRIGPRRFAILCTVPAVCALPGCVSGHVDVEQVGAMREVMRDGHTEPRIRLADVLARPNAHAVGALPGLSGEITIVDGDVWVARFAGNGIQVTGPALAEGDEATLLTVSHVAQWAPVTIGAALEGAQLEAFIAHAARERGLDVSRPFPFVIEGDATEVDLHVVNGYCPDARDPATIGAQPWRWSLDRSTRVLLVGFYAPNAAGVMTHHGTAMHVHAIVRQGSDTISGHVDRFAVGPGMILRVPAAR